MGHQGHTARDYSESPMNVYWEMTQACGLACRHCRAEAMPEAHPDQMNFEQSLRFLRQIPEFGQPFPQLILTGGDPLERVDLFEIIDEAVRLGISVSITPAATTKLTREILAKLKAHGVEGLGLSLDASTAILHDGIRGVPGTFDRTIQALGWAQELGMPVQVNSLVAKETHEDMPAVYELLKPFGVKRWSLFFLISVGRGKVLEALEPFEAEVFMCWVFETSKDAPMLIATTEAPSYRRVAVQQIRGTGEPMQKAPVARSFGIRDGHGIVFVSNTGEVHPSGFLPIPTGNVQQRRLVEIYRHHPTFELLHDSSEFKGRCGVCEYHTICGGSRARAFAATGDPLASDPLCNHQPRPVQTTVGTT